MGLTLYIDQLAEIGIDGHENPFLRGSKRQHLLVTGILPQLAQLEDVVALIPEPGCDPPAGTAIYQELQTATTWTASRLSCAMTARA